MGQSLSQVIIHIIFSTKNREPYLKGELKKHSHAYLAVIIRNLGSETIRIGGTEDHIHIACTLPRTMSQSELIKEIKSNSSKWLHDEGLPEFHWQTGYGAFSISPSHISLLVDYIDNQEEHHKTRSFKDEFRAFMKKYGLDFDERYVWD